jgi:hypothetical protein
MSTYPWYSAGLLVEVKITVFIITTQILRKLLALVNNLSICIEYWKMGAYIYLIRWKLIEIPFAIFFCFITLIFCLDSFTIFNITFLSSESVLMCTNSRVSAWILNINELAPRIDCALIWRSLFAQCHDRLLSSVFV